MKRLSLVFSIIAIIIVLVMSVVMAGCKTTTTTETTAAATAAAETTAAATTAAGTTAAATTAAGTTQITIGCTVFNVGANSYTTVYDKVIKARAKELDINLIMLDSKGDAALQASQVEDLIQQKVDVMIIWPTDGTAIVASMKKVMEAGIPLVIGNSAVDESGLQYQTTFVGPDQREEGKLAGDLMVEALNGTGKVVELMGSPGYSVSIDRHDGFMDAIKGTKIELIDSQPADWNTEKARVLMETYLAKYSQIDGAYCADDGVSAGVMQALDAIGKNDGSIKITTATVFASGYDAIVDGKEYGSVVQSPVVEANLTIETALKVANGEKVDPIIYFHCITVTKANADQVERPIW